MQTSYKKILFSLLLLLTFVGCSPSSQNEDNKDEKKTDTANLSTSIIGMWDTGKDIYNFYEDGRLETLNNLYLSGYSWKIENSILTLSFLDSPASKPKEEIYSVETVRTSRLVLKDSQGSKVVWNRAKEKTVATQAELFYLERIALPPKVLIHYEFSQESAEEKKTLNSSYFAYIGSVPIPFKAFYLEENRDKNLPVMLSVTLYYKANALFSTKEPIILDTQAQKIRLERVTNEELSPAQIIAPQAFDFTREEEDAHYYATLYLENKNLFFLIQERDEKNDGIEEKESFITWGYWNQVGRGHSIELIPSAKDTLAGAVHQDKSLFFDTLPLFTHVRNIEMSPISKKMTEKQYFTIRGIVTKENDDFLFVPTGLSKNFKLLGNVLVNPQLSSLKNKDSLYIEVNASYSNEGYFDVQNIISTENAKASQTNPASTELKNTYWRLTELNGKKELKHSQAEPHFILNTEDTKAKKGEGAGSDGCNSFFFTWTTNKESLDIILGGSTMRLCPEAGVEEQAREYLQILDKANNYSIQGSSLELKENDKNLATFEAVAL